MIVHFLMSLPTVGVASPICLFEPFGTGKKNDGRGELRLKPSELA